MAGRKSRYCLETKEENKKTIWMVALYIRLSQEDGDNNEEKLESNSITSQKNLLNEFIKEHEDLQTYNTYVDDGYTGTDFNRPAFRQMLEDIKQGLVTSVIVKDLSRLGRNYIEVGNYIEQIFPLFNIRFIAINDNVDSYQNPTSTNTILIPFKNLINDEYCRDTSIKIKSALNARKKKGEFVGAFPAYGYKKSEENNHKLIIDEEASKVVKKIFEWKVNEGLGNLGICYRLNTMGILNPSSYKRKKLHQNYYNHNNAKEDYSWSVSTIRNILKNDIYIGNVTQGKRRVKSYKIHNLEQIPKEEWIRIENMHEPIISKELFEKAQNLQQKDTKVQKSGKLSMWAGILKCGTCGHAMHKKYSKNKLGKIYEYYVCGTYQKKSHNLCTKHTIRQESLEEAVLMNIQSHIAKYANIETVLKILEKTDLKNNNQGNFQEEKKKQIDKIKNLKKGLYEDWKNNNITKEEYLEYKQSYEAEIEKLNNHINELECSQNKVKQIKSEKLKWVENFKKNKNISNLDRNIIEEFIDKIVVEENNQITIYFKFKIN